MESRIKRTQRDYSLAFKLSVVEQVEKGELSYKEALRRYGIQGRSTVLVWLRKHGRPGWSGWSLPTVRGVDMDRQGKGLTPEQRIKELEVQLKEARKKAQVFEAVVSVLEKDYGVRVVKSLRACPHAEARPRAERGKGLPLHGPKPPGLLQEPTQGA